MKWLQRFIHNLRGPTMQQFDDLVARVHETETVEASAVALIQGLQLQLAALASQATIDPMQVQALAQELADKTAPLAAAVANVSPGPVPGPA